MRVSRSIAAHAALIAATLCPASAQTTPTNGAASAAVSPTPQGNYTGDLRPQIHYSPPSGFMNDPNGMFRDAKGIWHLYYQYNPTAIVAGNQHWGHATSADLYNWTNQPIALSPGKTGEAIFSGSAVIDYNNTSGFFPNQTNGVVAIYTLHTSERQTQDIAYSFDDGHTFTKYANNPVIPSNSTQFRDPKVIWYKDHWVMVIAFAQEFAIGIYTSPNLIDWTHTSNFSHHGLLGLQYECPNLVSLPYEGREDPAWLMTISINPGAPLGGSIMQYFPGEFNGTHFEATDAAARISDFSKDNYAGQFFYGIPEDEDQVFIAWASNWEYAQTVPTGPLEGWRSAMTVPRRSFLRNTTRIGVNLVSLPYNLEAIYDEVLVNKTMGNGTAAIDYSTVDSGALYLRVNVSGLPTAFGVAKGTLNFTFTASSTNESFSGGYFFGGDSPFWLNRGKIDGFSENPFFSDKFSVAIPVEKSGVFLLEGVIDRSIFEVFINDGDRSATSTFYPNGVLDTLTVAADGLDAGVKVDVVVRSLAGGWN